MVRLRTVTIGKFALLDALLLLRKFWSIHTHGAKLMLPYIYKSPVAAHS